MSNERRSFLRRVMQTAWYAFRNRHIPGSNVRSFADALRNAWSFLRPRVKAAAPVREWRIRHMGQSPIRRTLAGRPYAYTEARWAGRTTTALGL